MGVARNGRGNGMANEPIFWGELNGLIGFLRPKMGLLWRCHAPCAIPVFTGFGGQEDRSRFWHRDGARTRRWAPALRGECARVAAKNTCLIRCSDTNSAEDYQTPAITL